MNIWSWPTLAKPTLASSLTDFGSCGLDRLWPNRLWPELVFQCFDRLWPNRLWPENQCFNVLTDFGQTDFGQKISVLVFYPSGLETWTPQPQAPNPIPRTATNPKPKTPNPRPQTPESPNVCCDNIFNDDNAQTPPQFNEIPRKLQKKQKEGRKRKKKRNFGPHPSAPPPFGPPPFGPSTFPRFRPTPSSPPSFGPQRRFHEKRQNCSSSPCCPVAAGFSCFTFVLFFRVCSVFCLFFQVFLGPNTKTLCWPKSVWPKSATTILAKVGQLKLAKVGQNCFRFGQSRFGQSRSNKDGQSRPQPNISFDTAICEESPAGRLNTSQSSGSPTRR